MERVREIILGEESAARRLRQPEVDRLREILFGPQMEEYERRFTDFHREMERMMSDLRQVQDSVSDFEKAQTRRVESLEQDTSRANDELRREVERLRTMEATLQQLLTQVRQQEMRLQELTEGQKRLQDALSKQEQALITLKTTVYEHRDQRERKLDDLKRELRQAEDDLRAELRRVADRLNDQKTDRRALSAMLMEIATRLETGSSVTGLLEGLTT
ncbi:MAG TPA: hypothetical protein ENK17_06410 [Anaerolineae bacterium]|nr:hypothetical protein [Anaerolineae bacterium]